MQQPPAPGPRVVGRYALYDEIASGGMASVHLGRLLGPVGFSRTVAIKRLHPQFARDPEFVSMFLDEARLAARIRHPNVVSTLDVIAMDGELLVVMDYVQGESLSRLLRFSRQTGNRIPLRIVVSVVAEMLSGLHAAHEARSERGEPLGIVHRDVSPQNVLVGTDGVARVVDFGVAKAVGRVQVTREGQLKGKIPYMAPEQILAGTVDRRTDVYAAAVVLWEALVGRRLHEGGDAELMYRVLEAQISPPSHVAPGLPAELDAIVMRGLSRDPVRRYATASAMAEAMEKVVLPSTAREVGRWVEQAAAEVLAARAAKVAEVESSSSVVDLTLSSVLRSSSNQSAEPAVREEPQTLTSASVASNKISTGIRPNKSRRLAVILSVGLTALLAPLFTILGLHWQKSPAERPDPSQVVVPAASAPATAVASSSATPVDSTPAEVASTAPTAPVPVAGKTTKLVPIAAPPVTATTKTPSKNTNKKVDDFGF